ncbi:hypothetical protein [Sphingobacterium multivorum]|uniref:hypothetical protein n=1 Tax=Sphingobacterium multivorum TaxID=28454 RepID=UPI0028A997E7|nr:hypothetical protein [Sphingobacterium multivorum]
MKLKFYKPYIFALALLALGGSCQSPLKDFNLVVSSNVIKDRATIKVLDAAGASIPNVSIKLLAGDTEDVYNEQGYKSFPLVGDLVVFGLDPNRTPTTTVPVEFTIEISAAGYYKQIVPLSITGEQMGIHEIRLVKELSNVEGVVVATQTAALVGGVTNKEIAVNLDGGDSYIDMKLNIPAGTSFQDANGKIISGGLVNIAVQALDRDQPGSLALFPGQSLTANAIVMPDGSQRSGVFNPAASAVINMSINGVKVRKFSNPIQISFGLNPDFRYSGTNQGLASGQQMPVYSFTDEDGFWAYQSTPTVQLVDGQFRLVFGTDHLSTFVATQDPAATCISSVIEFQADWINQGLTYPIVVEAWANGILLTTRTFSIDQDTKTVALGYLPSQGLTYRIKNSAGTILKEVSAAACGTSTLVQLGNPTPPLDKVTLQLYVRCPGKGIITVLPSFQLYYRLTGSNTWLYLGQVDKGLISTAMLKSDGTKYDFKAIYNGKTKVVNGKTVQKDNSGTIGINPGDIIGEKAGATNLAILVEECNKL